MSAVASMEMGGESEGPQAVAWRHWVTTQLVSVVVHRANNAIAAQLGTVDLLTREPEKREEHLEAIHTAAQDQGSFLGAFSRFSKPAGVRGDAELGAVLRDATRLIGAVLHEAAGKLDLRAPSFAVPVGAAAQRIEQLLVALVSSLVLDLEAPRDGVGPRCRVRVQVRGAASVSICVAVDRGCPERFGPVARRELQRELQQELGERGGALRVRAGASRCALRLDLPALTDLSALGASEVRPTPASRRTVLVHLAEPMLAELVKAVLAECGIDAEPTGDADGLLARLSESSWSLYLLEVDRLTPAQLELCRSQAPRIVVLSAGAAPPGDWFGVLPMPFRPKELIELLG